MHFKKFWMSLVKELKNTVPRTYAISDFKGKETIGTFYEKELQQASQKEFRIEKLIKTKKLKTQMEGL